MFFLVNESLPNDKLSDTEVQSLVRDKEISLEWFAGFFDGEGNAAIARSSSTPKALRISGSKSPVYNLLVAVSNTKENVLCLFRDKFGGSISPIYKTNPHHSTIYRWTISGKKGLDFLNLVYPFLQIKNKEVEIARKFMALPKSLGSHGVPLSLTQLRESYLREIKLLHTSGKGVSRKGRPKESSKWDEQYFRGLL